MFIRTFLGLIGLLTAAAAVHAQPPRKAEKPRFTVPDGFRVEPVIPAGTMIEGVTAGKFALSIVNMCFDAKGRLLVSQERGPVLLWNDGKLDIVCDRVTNCQGMCWAHNSLYLVGDGPKGVGLYRCTASKGSEKFDLAEQLMKFKGSMGEHGPHAVIHGPDDKLYVVIGNHAWADVGKVAERSPLTRWPTGLEGPDQNKPGTTEDVLLPRLNDANGHAANRLAPGGTIWRVDLDGGNPSLVAAGFRNQFDAAFNPAGELFTFDSDMEWDLGLPWYRHVRISHCPPGADFVWRTGAANTPNDYLDSLPPLVETGRGSPTGVECYDHAAFPAKYRGAIFTCDWSIGTIWVCFPERSGASYKATFEKFCSGTPMPVSDCVVGPDGALYFALGGRGTQGSVHRIVHDGAKAEELTENEQPLAAWSKLRQDGEALPADVLRLPKTQAEQSARAVYLFGLTEGSGAAKAIAESMRHADPFVRRRACEAAIRLGHEVAVSDLTPLLASDDRFLRTAARLVLQRIDPKKWATALVGDADDRVAHEAIVALCKIGKANDFTDIIFERLHDKTPGDSTGTLLEWVRTVQLALVHCEGRPQAVRGIALDCRDLFPTKDSSLNREMAILLAEFARTKHLVTTPLPKLLAAMREAKADRPQQIHYAYCLRVISDGWTPEQKEELLIWYEGTRTWTGGNSFSGFINNIMGDLRPIWNAEEQKAIIAKFDAFPLSALMMLRGATPENLPNPERLSAMLASVQKDQPKANEIKIALVDALSRSTSPDAPAALRALADKDPTQHLSVARILARKPLPENFPYLLKGLTVASAQIAPELIEALIRNPVKPKPDDTAAWRTAIASAGKLQGTQKWKAVELLRHWSASKSFGGEKKEDWKSELASWGRWFGQSFPKEPALPDAAGESAVESKFKLAELAAYLEQDAVKSKADAVRGKLVFAKANCIKCHKYGAEGEGIGPDLTQLSKRFKRSEILESILLPSKVISDQYRSSLIMTLDGRTYIGLLAEQGGMVTVLLQDANKVMLKSGDIESKFASLVSVMPEKLMEELTKEEIADLFAYLDSSPPEKK